MMNESMCAVCQHNKSAMCEVCVHSDKFNSVSDDHGYCELCAHDDEDSHLCDHCTWIDPESINDFWEPKVNDPEDDEYDDEIPTDGEWENRRCSN